MIALSKVEANSPRMEGDPVLNFRDTGEGECLNLEAFVDQGAVYRNAQGAVRFDNRENPRCYAMGIGDRVLNEKFRAQFGKFLSN